MLEAVDHPRAPVVDERAQLAKCAVQGNQECDRRDDRE